MKVKNVTLGLGVVWAFHLLLCGGCASRDVKVPLNYAPAETSLLSDLKPVVVSLQVVDERPSEERTRIGVRRNTQFGAEGGSIVSKIPEAQVVHTAIQTELERGGHHVLNPGQGRADIALNVALTEFLVDSQAAGLHIELLGSIRADVVASVAAGNTPQDSFMVESAHRNLVQLGWARPAFFGIVSMLSSTTSRSQIERAMNGALAEFVRRFCLAPKLRQAFARAVGTTEVEDPVRPLARSQQESYKAGEPARTPSQWKVFSDTARGFSIRYPASWRVRSEGDAADAVSGGIGSKPVFAVQAPDGASLCIIVQPAVPLPTNVSEEGRKKYLRIAYRTICREDLTGMGWKCVSEEFVSLAGHPGVEYTWRIPEMQAAVGMTRHWCTLAGERAILVGVTAAEGDFAGTDRSWFSPMLESLSLGGGG